MVRRHLPSLLAFAAVGQEVHPLTSADFQDRGRDGAAAERLILSASGEQTVFTVQ